MTEIDRAGAATFAKRIADKRAEIVQQYRAINEARTALRDTERRLEVLTAQMRALAEEEAETVPCAVVDKLPKGYQAPVYVPAGKAA